MDYNSSASTERCLRFEDNCGPTMVWILMFLRNGGPIFGITRLKLEVFGIAAWERVQAEGRVV